MNSQSIPEVYLYLLTSVLYYITPHCHPSDLVSTVHLLSQPSIAQLLLENNPNMSPPTARLLSLASHLLPSTSTSSTPSHPPHIHTLSPTSFLPRAAAIEPSAPAIFHVTANNKVLRRNYAEFADRSRGLAYFLKKHGFRRVGILLPNTPAFLEAIFGIAASGAVNVAVNYRLKVEDVTYIFGFGEVSFGFLVGVHWDVRKGCQVPNPSII